MHAPSRSEVVAKFRQLIRGPSSREEVATWAEKWVIVDNPPCMEADLWEALKFLAGADLISTDRPFLYSTQDFECELAKLVQS